MYVPTVCKPGNNTLYTYENIYVGHPVVQLVETPRYKPSKDGGSIPDGVNDLIFLAAVWPWGRLKL